MRSLVDAQDVADMVIYLSSPTGGKISGQSISVDGHTD
jgi:hypothetical protein